MCLCDKVNIKGSCRGACPFGKYENCDFPSKEKIIAELYNIIEKANFAKEALILLEG